MGIYKKYFKKSFKIRIGKINKKVKKFEFLDIFILHFRRSRLRSEKGASAC